MSCDNCKRAEAERDECFEVAAKALGSDYRNVGVVQALAGWVERLRAERDALRERVRVLEEAMVASGAWKERHTS